MEKRLTVTDLAEAAARKGIGTKREAEALLRTLFAAIEKALETEPVVKIKGLGAFKLVNVARRESTHVLTGERIEIEEHTRLTFVPETAVKERINRPFAAFQSAAIHNETPLEQLEKVEIEEETTQTEEEDPAKQTEPQILNEEIMNPQEQTPAQTTENQTEETKPQTTEEQTETVEQKPCPSPATATKTLDTGTKARRKSIHFWQLTSCILGLLLVSFISYFLGYMRLLGPDVTVFQEQIKRWQSSVNVGTQVVLPVLNAETPASKDTTAAKPKAAPVKTAPAAEEPLTLNPKQTYQITGTRKTVVVGRGQTLQKIARAEYGHNDFASYIIRYNQLEYPDEIPAGMTLKLPELQLK